MTLQTTTASGAIDPVTKDAHIIAGGLNLPSGITFSSDQKVVCVTDNTENSGQAKEGIWPASSYVDVNSGNSLYMFSADLRHQREQNLLRAVEPDLGKVRDM